MDACADVCAAAMARALERFDRPFPDARRPVGAKAHDVRERTLLCECGQATFRRRRFELADGTRFCVLDEAFGPSSGSRVSRSAFAMARDDALVGSYARAAELLCRHARTKLSRRAVGSILREAVETLEKADSQAARDLFEPGPAADAEAGAEALCVEADGTWPALQRDPMGRARSRPWSPARASGKRPAEDVGGSGPSCAAPPCRAPRRSGRGPWPASARIALSTA